MIKTYGMDDVGTRAEHLSDLHDLWSFAFGILTTDLHHSMEEKHRADELNVAINLLVHHMQSEYKPTLYARVINELPKPKDIDTSHIT